ncbi:MAG: hypothetical protein RBQ99_01635 [Trichlorobacter sp.]|jgi:hypothetical protein|nr:hypothetical protein [Trichlorobacter sp.]
MKVEFKNLTPHPLTIEGLGTIEPSGTVPRVASLREVLTPVAGVRVVQQSFGSVENLPAPQEGVILIVSAMVLSALAGSRSDVFAPDTGADAIRNEKGHIVAVRGLVQ